MKTPIHYMLSDIKLLNNRMGKLACGISMAQEFWDESKQQEMRKIGYLNWAKAVADTLTEEVDETTKKQLIEKIIDLLEKNNIDFNVVNGNKILIKGDVKFVSLPGYAGGYQDIVIVQGDKEIAWDVFLDMSRLLVTPLGASGHSGVVELPRDINVEYSDGYLSIIF